MGLSQGALALLDTDLARRLLQSRTLARLAYTWTDGTPRVVPIWFHWTGEELVFGSFATAPKIRALHASPNVAVTIDTEDYPHEVLMVRGRARVDIQPGVVPEYAASARRYLGEEGSSQWLAHIERPDLHMARIAVRPEWVGTIDFQSRMPGPVGGVRD